MDDARNILKVGFSPPEKSGAIPVTESAGRFTIKPLYASFNVPNTDVATMDGYAVCAEDFVYASDRNPVRLRDETWINTGNSIPTDYNAVIAVEDVYSDNGSLFTRKSVLQWQNIKRKGSEIKKERMILPSGHLIRKYDIAPLVTYGISKVDVPQISVGLIPTGSELVSSGMIPGPGQVIESNTVMADAWLSEIGVTCRRYPITGDHPESIRSAINEAVFENDLVIISAGTSAGSRDYTARILAETGEILVHGIAMIPGKPTIIGRVSGKPVIGLPGSPQAAQTVLRELVIPLCTEWGMRSDDDEQCTVRLTQAITSEAGFDEFVPLIIGSLNNEIIASPLSRAPGMQRSSISANGYIHIPKHIEGYPAGSVVAINLTGKRSEIEHSLIISGQYHPYLDWLSNNISSKHISLYFRDSGILGGILSLRKNACHATPLSFSGSTGAAQIPYLAEYFDMGELASLHIAQMHYGILSRDPLETMEQNNIRFIEGTVKVGTETFLHHIHTRFDAHNLITISNKESICSYNNPEALQNNLADICIADQATADAYKLCFTPLETERYEILLVNGYSEDCRIESLIESVRMSSFIDQLSNTGFDTSRTGIITEIQ
ncbi:molybdopterin biosynthesis protein [Methanocalculus taiwanensis]|uniref:Molybdopterin biosynthesis protein n=1 Tax=Methanocalculus taiwanensis TaxID=106207 RepID=A0ABD4TNP2_9EURY|nr:molybdopterin-binding protein [Methanocalculus taiwanensis]MCQ1539470.1 molybdopterin biosynthesis protein [Methanocalculus taiwanensis]